MRHEPRLYFSGLASLALLSGCSLLPLGVLSTPAPAAAPAPEAVPPQVVVAEPPPAPPVEVAPAVAVDEGSMYPTSPPPDPIPEYRPTQPAWDYVWINGYWSWTGYDWSWDSGYWIPRREGVSYVAPRYVFVDGQFVFYRSYWIDSSGRREYGYGWRGAPPAAWRARPSYEPGAWRAEHNQGWRNSPGAAGWRGERRAEERRDERIGERRAEERRDGRIDERRAEEHRVEEHRGETPRGEAPRGETNRGEVVHSGHSEPAHASAAPVAGGWQSGQATHGTGAPQPAPGARPSVAAAPAPGKRPAASAPARSKKK